MPATIIITVILAGIVGWVIYRMIRNAQSGQGRCAGCSYVDDCEAAKILPKKADNDCPKRRKSCCS